MLLHITSLPSRFAVGDLGPGAYSFADFLALAKQRLWQVLPLNPTEPVHGNSPYSSISAFAGNTLLVSPELLVSEGLLPGADIDPAGAAKAANRCDYGAAAHEKKKFLGLAYDRFLASRWKAPEYERFAAANKSWLEDYALFAALKKHFDGELWTRWPKEYRDRDEASLRSAKSRFARDIDRAAFFQFLFFEQWAALRSYCASKGIRLVGDIPIYVNLDSADVWANRRLFKLAAGGAPLFVAGVPPDYFSRTGQLWGNPVYDWAALQADGYRWWMERFARNLELFDYVRVDHFRGFVGFWEVPSGEKTAVNGRWVKAPAENFFAALLERFPAVPLIAEDLGVITPDVVGVMEKYRIPGMRVLLFAFGDDDPRHPYLPHNYVRNCVVYTGTHDNNTARGWFAGESKPEERRRLMRYLGREVAPEALPVELIRLLMMSPADAVVIPMQDLLGLGEEARMNRPAIPEGNWEWRLLPGQTEASLAESLASMTTTYGRAPDASSSKGSG